MYSFQRSVPFAIRRVSDGSNVAAAPATASAAVGRSSLASVGSLASSASGVVDGPDRSVVGSVSVASRVLGPPGPAAVPAVERASVVYYGWHDYPEGRILNNCLC
ncbi:hypothetical protein C463_05530 [Halorubrum californiense DSM 19288]|uniref:Uncharacterized protein n=1 Tax=Halorubrum californiense DSM 19288 TaxID=1227465 RepID=M0EDJ4_9EURY|nr:MULTISPECIES: hypothetical protein [Halorubrum]ELZ45866.1 hypothetical protein C463_05530 [Halorubrum californiense DSM 19288]TKX69625.1 hypothetical protein EXE40_10540 [Halorubrum sp. GN11GM_10-3_MGM]